MRLLAFNVGVEIVDIANFDPLGPDVGTKVRTPYFFYAIGVDAADIRHVALSHLHIDHAGGVGHLPNATFYVQGSELAAAFSPPVYQRDFYVRGDFDHPVRWQRLDGEHDVFGDQRIVLFPTPGHSVGHQSMLVRLDHSTVILVADAAYWPRNLEQRRLPAIVWNPDAMVASWERIEALRDREGAELIYTHDLAWRERTGLAPEAWYA